MKISYTRSYPIGAFLQEKIGFEVEYETADPVKELEYLKSMCDEAHKRLNPHLESNANQYSNGGSSYAGAMDGSGTREAIPIPPTIEAIITDINNCKSISEKNSLGVETGLLSYEHLCATPRIKEAYDKKLLELQNQ